MRRDGRLSEPDHAASILSRPRARVECFPGARRAGYGAAALPPVVVTRDVRRSPLELPYAISSIRPDSLVPGQTHTFVEQTLSLIPGLTVANRNNPSQDARISIRGFGARSAFGVRSLRVLRDGMPLTLPDGQTPIDYLDLEAVGQVETIRGSASALYGNASGGVIDLRSAPPPAALAAVQLRSWAGSNAFRRNVALFGGSVGSSSYAGNIGRTSMDGYRAYAEQRLTNAFVRARVPRCEAWSSGFSDSGWTYPVAWNPGALTQGAVRRNPRIADPLSVSKRARKEVHQVQLGLSARRNLRGDGDIVLQGYGSGRSLYNPLTFAIVGVDRRTSGASLRATVPVGTNTLRHRLTIGVDAQRLNDARKNWTNCNAVPTRRSAVTSHAVIAELRNHGTSTRAAAAPAFATLLVQVLRINPNDASGRVQAAADLGPPRADR